MDVDEYSSRPAMAPPDRFGMGARDNFPSGFQSREPPSRVAAVDNSAMNMGGGGASAADLDRAIAASMEENFAAGGGGAGGYLDDDAELARIMELSKNLR